MPVPVVEASRVNVTLETEWDRHYEEKFMRRYMSVLPEGMRYFRMPQYSVVDYMIARNYEVRYMMELKIRKETVEKVKSYGGLMLKHRKIVELNALQDAAKTEIWIVFAFDNGEGEVLVTRPNTILDLPLEAPPRRRNYRGLATDEDPVCYLDWDVHLTRWRM